MFLALDVGGSTIRYIKADADNLQKCVCGKSPFLHRETAEQEIQDNVINCVYNALSRKELNSLEGIGIATAAIMDRHNETIKYWPNNPIWSHVPLGKLIRKEFNVPLIFEDDANSAAFGEFNSLHERSGHIRNMVCITLGTGIGCGLILNGQIFRGDDGTAGELGHTKIAHSSAECVCGNKGCLQANIAPNSILKAYNILANESCTSIADLANRFHTGDVIAKAIVDQFLIDLSEAVFNISMLLGIQHFVLGGGVATLFENLQSILEKMVCTLLNAYEKSVHIYAAALGEWSGVHGALRLICTQVHGESI